MQLLASPPLTPLMPFEEACAEVLAFLKQRLPMGFWSVTRLQGRRQVCVAVQDDVYGKTQGQWHLWSDSLCQHMVTGRTPSIAPDAMAVPEYAATGAAQVMPIGAYMGVPIRAGDGSLFGTICGLDPNMQSPELAEYAPVLRLLADLLGRVLEAETLRAEADQRSDELRWQAFHDQLTGLPNRAMFFDRLQHAVDLHRRSLRPLAVLLLDLDDFKAVNDSLGHGAGDDLLVRVAARVQRVLRAGDTFARLSGDEFALLLEDGGEPSVIARRILDALGEPFLLTGSSAQVTVGGSIGVVELPTDALAVSVDEILARADIAMYSAKRSGKGCVALYDPVMTLPAVRDLALREPLRQAIATGELQVHYQPVVDIGTGQPVAFEALARWQHQGEWIPPDVFVPVAARSGLLPDLTAHVLETAGAQLARWSAQLGHARLRVSANIPTAIIADRSFPDRVADLIARHGLAPEQLVLEITEDALVADLATARAVSRSLRDVGAGLALDDFGTGYSSLVHLRQIPLQFLKIDRGFVGDLDTNPDAERFMRALFALGRDLDLTVVVEGVERPEQLQALQGLGCRYVQGFFFARAAAASDCRLPTASVWV